MNKFDEYIKDEIKREEFAGNKKAVPKHIEERIDMILSELPDTSGNNKVADCKETDIKVKDNIVRFSSYKTVMTTVASIAIFLLILMPNVSETYANAFSKIPFLGDFVRIITVRNYYQDKNHDMKVNKPAVDFKEDQLYEKEMNDDISELTDTLVKQFYADLEKYGDKSHSSLDVSYDIVTNTKNWFTLRIKVVEITGSSNTYYKLYHIDKKQNQIIYLKDLFADANYVSVIYDEIEKQMKEQMEEDESVQYWLKDNNDGIKENFSSIDEKQNFYWNENGDLVILFDKYEAGPGYMGTPEFCISRSVINDYLRDVYKR